MFFFGTVGLFTTDDLMIPVTLLVWAMAALKVSNCFVPEDAGYNV